MKSRQGFVSNSSTTSFVIIGHKIPLRDLGFEQWNLKLDGKKYLLVGGYGGGEGIDVAELTEERLTLLPFLDEADFEVWQVDKQIYESERGVELVGGTYDITSLEASMHTIEPADMPEYYGVDRYAVLEAVLEIRAIPELIRDALSEHDKSLIGMYKRGEITGDGVLQKLWEAGND